MRTCAGGACVQQDSIVLAILSITSSFDTCSPNTVKTLRLCELLIYLSKSFYFIYKNTRRKRVYKHRCFSKPSLNVRVLNSGDFCSSKFIRNAFNLTFNSVEYAE